MDIQVIDGKIQVQNARVGDTKTVASLTAYVCRPDLRPICRMNGVEGMTVKAKYIDISEISFVVNKYVINDTTHTVTKNPCYEYLHSFCCVLVPELGQYGLFRINEEPTINAKNRVEESKSFNAQSYESILQYEYLSGFKINQGTEDSLEMFDLNLSPSGAPIERIKLYDSEDESLSLLNLVLYDDLYDWEIYHVDSSIADKEASFSVDKKSVYSFLREDVQKAFRCIIDFDTIHRRINVYDIETVGNDTNILLSFERFVQQIDIEPSSSDIYTVFNVAGGNDLDISRVNFGSNKIVNIDYPITFLPESVQSSYASYKVFRNTQRGIYTNLYRQNAIYLAQRRSILDRQPSSDVENNWASTVYYSLSDLQDALADYQAVVTYIESLYTTGGVVDYEELDISPDAAEYYSYKNVIIPDITAAIEARQQASSAVDTVDIATQWQLYGINDLEVKLSAYKEITAALAEQGYTRAWSSTDDSISEETWNAHYNEYTTYMGYISTLETLIADRKTKLSTIESQIASLESQMTSIANSVALETFFDSETCLAIRLLYKETDYSDENYLVASYDTEAQITSEAELLYQAAVERLEVESRPQLSWSVSSDSLYAIPEFAGLRNSLQNGDYCIIAYGGNNRVKTHAVVNTSDGASMCVREDVGESVADSYYKLRVVEIDFDGLDLDKSFGLVFSDVISTTKEMNDFESLLGDFVSSKTNSIKALTLSSSATTASEIAQKIVRPYVEALQLQIENLKAQNIYVNDLNAVKITANQIRGGELTLGGLDNVDGTMQVLDADGNQVGYWSKDGIVATAGNIGGFAINADSILGTYEYTDDDGTYTARLGMSYSSNQPRFYTNDGRPSGYSTIMRNGIVTLLRNDNTNTSNTNSSISAGYLSCVTYAKDDDSETRVSTAISSTGVTVRAEDIANDSSKSSYLGSSNLVFRDPSNPQLARGIAHWTLLSIRRQLYDTLYVTVYSCGNLFWAHFDGTMPAGLSVGSQSYILPIIMNDDTLERSVYCAPPVNVNHHIIEPVSPSCARLIIRITSSGEIKIHWVAESCDGTGSVTTSSAICNCEIFWAHIG